MEITEVKVKVVESKNDRLQAFCSITIDNCFVIRDLKIIEGAKGAFVAMPSRKIMGKCPHCSAKNHIKARFCNECGVQLTEGDKAKGAKLHADIAHPINSECRNLLQDKILEVYEKEKAIFLQQFAGQPA
ncbi:SpoVG family protein [Candidatus Uabimicrobium amorphum]|uniref:Stage V sporulation protein G n=1 Tax=Uabimicrobium amorphum TaxID=2596890 RepID=A0A5S9F2W7_UABAM|nr:SpoVG family protein [Candidatus Uabimicrobium amorphum]BBM84125.1 stage V sporulation protein G [Candidatus Uabimicrobium amorphum]